MTEKQKFNLERWRLLIQDRQNSGLSVRDWCSMNGYTKDAYYYWLGRLRKEVLPSALDQLQPPAVTQTFVDVTPLPVSEPESEMTPETAFIKPYEDNPEIPSAVIRKNGMRKQEYLLLTYFLTAGLQIQHRFRQSRKKILMSLPWSRKVVVSSMNMPAKKLSVKEIFSRNKERRGRSKYLRSVDVMLGKENPIPAKIVCVRNKANRKDWLAFVCTDMKLVWERDILSLPEVLKKVL